MGESDKKQEKAKRKFSDEQYQMLLRCSEKKDITEWNEWRKDNPEENISLKNADLKEAHLEGVNLSDASLQNADLTDAQLWGADLGDAFLRGAKLIGAHLKGADFGNAYLEGANLSEAYLENVNFIGAYLKDASLTDAHLEGARFFLANLQRANFQLAIVDGSTLFSECIVDHYTDFRNVGLHSARIEQEIKQLLEYNNRRMDWDLWYKGHPKLQWLVKPFWLMSDYGRSTIRIVGTFFFLALGFAAIYANCACWWPPGIVTNLDVEPHLPLWHYFLLVLLRPVYFSIVTMTTLGFGDMHADATSIWGHVLLTFQVILGYVLLGALVTRFAVLFTAGGPAGKFADEKAIRHRLKELWSKIKKKD